MNHSIIGPSKNNKNSYGAAAAADYVIGGYDSKKAVRFKAPIILSGSRDGFVRMAESSHSQPSYLSIAIADKSRIIVPRIRYISSVYLTHYLAGIRIEDVGHLSVLHACPTEHL